MILKSDANLGDVYPPASEIASTSIKWLGMPGTMQCTGNICCDVEGTCNDISYPVDPGMDGSYKPSLGVSSLITQFGNWVKANPLIAVGGLVGLALISGGRRR